MSIKEGLDFKERIVSIGLNYYGIWLKDEQAFVRDLNQFDGMLDMLCTLYSVLKKFGMEDMAEQDEETKQRLWTQAKEWCTVNQTEQRVVKFAKVIWAIKYITENIDLEDYKKSQGIKD